MMMMTLAAWLGRSRGFDAGCLTAWLVDGLFALTLGSCRGF